MLQRPARPNSADHKVWKPIKNTFVHCFWNEEEKEVGTNIPKQTLQVQRTKCVNTCSNFNQCKNCIHDTAASSATAFSIMRSNILSGR